MNYKLALSGAALVAMLTISVDGRSEETSAAPGAQAAALTNEAAAMEANIDKVCHKLAIEARPMCRAQYAQAVQRLRTRAARLR